MYTFTVLAMLLQLLAAAHARPLDNSVDSKPRTSSNNTSTNLLPTQLIYDFGPDSWIENLAIRSNGHILATEDIPHPILYYVNPFASEQNRTVIINDFSNVTASILGIVETSPDIFHICSSNASASPPHAYGENYIFRIDMRSFDPVNPRESAHISQVGSIPQAGLLNGMTYMGGETNSLFIADFLLGLVWTFNLTTNETRVAVNNTYTRSSSFAIDGIKIFQDRYLYFTNSGQETFVKVPLNPQGEVVGPYTTLMQGEFAPDDFAIDDAGNSYVTSFTLGKEGLFFVPSSGGNGTLIAEMKGPTSAAFGRTKEDLESGALYVTTCGGDFAYDTDPVTVSGKIYRVDVGGRAK